MYFIIDVVPGATGILTQYSKSILWFNPNAKQILLFIMAALYGFFGLTLSSQFLTFRPETWEGLSHVVMMTWPIVVHCPFDTAHSG